MFKNVREISKQELSALQEKASDVAMYENTATDGGHTPEEMFESFGPMLLDARKWAEWLWEEWTKENLRLVNTRDGGPIEFKHIRFCGKEQILEVLTAIIVKEFPYTNYNLPEAERFELYKNTWCFSR